jgi:cytoskeletal protein RodZ
MTTSTTDPKREPGYRGSLPPRQDRLAKPWILTVAGIFVLIIVLSIAGVPSAFFPDPTPLPTPVATPSPSADASAEASESPDASESAEPSDSAEPSGSPSVEPSPSS